MPFRFGDLFWPAPCLRHGGHVGTEAASRDGPELRHAGRDSWPLAAGCFLCFFLGNQCLWMRHGFVFEFNQWWGVEFEVQEFDGSLVFARLSYSLQLLLSLPGSISRARSVKKALAKDENYQWSYPYEISSNKCHLGPKNLWIRKGICPQSRHETGAMAGRGSSHFHCRPLRVAGQPRKSPIGPWHHKPHDEHRVTLCAVDHKKTLSGLLGHGPGQFLL